MVTHQTLERNYTERRKCVMKMKLQRCLLVRDFKEVFCENLTMEEKVGMFRMQSMLQVQLVVEWLMSLFSPPETKVFYQLNSPTLFLF